MDKNKVFNDLIQIVKRGLNPTLPLPKNIDEKTIFALSKINEITALCFLGLKGYQLDSEVYSNFEEEYTLSVSTVALHGYYAEKIVEGFIKNGIKFMLLKGIVIRKLYDKPECRVSGDVDILVCKGKTKDAEVVLNNLGFTKESTGICHDIFIGNGMIVEIHESLFYGINEQVDDKYIEFLDSYDCDQLQCEMDNVDLFIYAMTHTYKHFVNGGVGLRFIIDLYLIRNNLSTEELSLSLKKLESLDLGRFSEKILQVCDYIFYDKTDDKEIEFLAQYITFSGVFGNKKSNIVSKEINDTGKVGKKVSLIKRIFPPWECMVGCSKVLYKHPILLPFFWIRRIFRFIFSKNKKRVLDSSKDYSQNIIDNVLRARKICGID